MTIKAVVNTAGEREEKELLRFLVEMMGGHSVFIVRPRIGGKGYLGWSPGPRGQHIILSELIEFVRTLSNTEGE